MVTIGPATDVWLRIDAVPDASSSSRAIGLAQSLVGIAVIGLGSALYIGAGRAAGPRDGLMLAIAHHSGLPLAVARNLLEATVLGLGFAFGGTVGLGTVQFAVAIGPAVAVAFWIVAHSPLEASAGTLADAPG